MSCIELVAELTGRPHRLPDGWGVHIESRDVRPGMDVEVVVRDGSCFTARIVDVVEHCSDGSAIVRAVRWRWLEHYGQLNRLAEVESEIEIDLAALDRANKMIVGALYARISTLEAKVCGSA